MSGRTSKEERLKHNLDTSAERWTRSECQRLGIGRQSDKAREMHQEHIKEMRESALRIDRTKLHEVWNH